MDFIIIRITHIHSHTEHGAITDQFGVIMTALSDAEHIQAVKEF